MMAQGVEADEALISAARQMFQGNRRRSERVCYYRTPQRRTDGSKHLQAGWITWGDTQDSIKLGKIMRGYIPLEQPFGYIRAKLRDEDPDAPFETYGHWGPLLAHPDGPREMPKEQVLAYHWYDANRLRASLRGQIPATLKGKGNMVLWPQLAGADLRIFACPECSDWRSLEAIFLARHLRVWHDYDRADIIAFGTQYGIDFATEINREGRVIQTFAFEDVPAEEFEPEPEVAGFTLDVARPERRGPGRPRKEP